MWTLIAIWLASEESRTATSTAGAEENNAPEEKGVAGESRKKGAR